ncbi:putative disease resistance RPP13-like protein 1 [Durio zibethinus]|uniref:Disease resistance RPP13-like protein 1 n=1 Tax=Durio zibethinus TaxID=66656 RepID=A0A6P6AH59_DURZI|nr:putative disease resistance RPP13-like protein 1 [Durio zibethinus]
MSIVEAALSVFFEGLFSNLASSEFLNFVTEKEVCEELNKMEKTLRNIHAVLNDAEEKEMNDGRVKSWLVHLQDLAYDVDDILDKFATEALRLKLTREHQDHRPRKLQKLVDACFTWFRGHNLSFNKEMMSEIKEITARFQVLEAGISLLALTKNGGGRPRRTWEWRSTTCLVNETQVYGREKDKETILDLIFGSDDSNKFSVIPIIGKGGIGKTTLAQLVYNDSRVVKHFDFQAWVCVSDDFKMEEITKSILQSVSPESFNVGDDLNNLQIKLKKKLEGKKLLLILDDLWHENYDDWTRLISPFGIGATIVVTTRGQSVSLMVSTILGYKLPELSDGDCISILTQHALGAKDFSGHPNLKEYGVQIVKRCKGLPLAAKTIGGLLRNKLDVGEWEKILRSEIWNLPEERSSIIPALRLSYHHLPADLKRCFAYCAILPKGYEFSEEEIVLLWMAEGFLRVEATKRNEDLGHEYFQELVRRSFFEVSSKNESRYIMHDLINDLAQSVAKDICFRVEDDKALNVSRHPRHLSCIVGGKDRIKNFQVFKRKNLRTFLPLKMPGGWMNFSNQVLSELLPEFKYLRVFSLQGFYLTEIPNIIGDLVHLRYLNFSYTLIKILPDSICKLYNLETLLLRGCSSLEELPSEMGFLINLRHLDIAGADSIKTMPMGIGELTNLQTLTNFVVSQDNGRPISEMKNLSNLKGELFITELQNVVEAQDAWMAGLRHKSNLRDLALEWSYNVAGKEIHKDVLDSLQPPKMLERLTIECYGGETFPNWIGDPSFEKLSILNLYDCPNCTLLPPVGRLPSIKSLSIQRMSKIKNVGANFFGKDLSINAFPSLEKLRFKDMPEWEEWDPCEVDENVRSFQHLHELIISNCPKLSGSLPNRLTSLKKLEINMCDQLRSLPSCLPSLKKLEIIWCLQLRSLPNRLPSLKKLEINLCQQLRSLPCCLPSLEKLVIEECEQLVVSLSSLPKLSDLEIYGCQEVASTSCTKSGSFIEKVSLSDISKFTSPMEGMMLGLIKAERLYIHGCEELISSWQNQEGPSTHLRRLPFLEIDNCSTVSIGAEDGKDEHRQLGIPCRIEHLSIHRCVRLERLSENLHSYRSLRELQIEGCPRLISISNGNLPPNLRRLTIKECENLQYLLGGVNNNINSRPLLEHLVIENCKSLISLSSRGELPMGLKYLTINNCRVLESIAQEIEENSSLELITIGSCNNFRSLPHGLNKLNHLGEIVIWGCPSLISFPGSGSFTTKLRKLHLSRCEKLQALPNCIHNIVSMRELFILDCPRVISFPEEGFPPNLTSLKISQPNICKSVIAWGLHKLTSLKHLYINGASVDVVSFPCEEMLLPRTLTSLTIFGFPNLETLSSKGFQNLKFLESLDIRGCPRLKFLPEGEMFDSLFHLYIINCPLLRERCKKDEGQEWPKIAHIRCILIG